MKDSTHLSLKKYYSIFFTLIIVSISFGAISLVFLNIQYDELNHHIPTTILFLNSDPITALLSREYSSANTPFPYLVNSLFLIIAALEPSVFTLRLINIILGLGFILLFFGFLKRFAPNNLFIAFLFFFYPYFLKTTFAYFMAIYGLVFLLLYLFVLKGNKESSELKGGVTVSLGVLSQQFLIPVLGYQFIRQIFTFTYHDIKGWLTGLSKFLLPAVPLLIVFLLWGGWTHPNYAKHAVGFSITSVATMLVSVGMPFLPFAARKVLRLRWKTVIVLLTVSLISAYWFFPVWTNAPQLGHTSGISFNILNRLTMILPFLGFLGKVFLIFTGLVTMHTILNPLSEVYQFKSLVLVMAFAFLFNEIASERHFVSLILVMFLAVSKESFPVSLKIAWVSNAALIGSGYFYYLNFIYRIS